jgi:hypothetical protein
VIGVAVGDEHGVDAAEPVRQRLLAQVGGGIDEDLRVPRDVDVDRRAEPLSFGSSEVQTAQSQPIIGTPCDVPVPRKVTRAGFKE